MVSIECQTTKMGQMGKRLWEKEGISLSTYQIQRKSYSV